MSQSIVIENLLALDGFEVLEFILMAKLLFLTIIVLKIVYDTYVFVPIN